VQWGDRGRIIEKNRTPKKDEKKKGSQGRGKESTFSSAMHEQEISKETLKKGRRRVEKAFLKK